MNCAPAHKLAPMAFYNWGNAIGDPTTSTGFAMFSPSPHSGWKSQDVDDMIGPLWGEKDEDKRIAGWKTVDEYIAEKGYVIPLVQYYAADRLQVFAQGDAERHRRAATDSGVEGVKAPGARLPGAISRSLSRSRGE